MVLSYPTTENKQVVVLDFDSKRNTRSQKRFMRSKKPMQAFIGGVGSGKTRTGCIKVLSMPPVPFMICAPTYKILKKVTIPALREFTIQAKIERAWRKSDMELELIDGRLIHFSSTDDPENLRGPNLGGFLLDEAALMPEMVWDIMIGRIRLEPGWGGLVTTPKGIDHWIYRTFVTNRDPDYEAIFSSTEENRGNLKAGFIERLRAKYTAAYAQQEIDGKFVNLSGTIFHREWLERRIEYAPPGLEWARFYDLAVSTKKTADSTASLSGAFHEGVLYIRRGYLLKKEWPDISREIVRIANEERDECRKIGIEEVAFQLAAVQEIRRNETLRDLYIRGYKPETDKMGRALPLAALAEQGRVVFVTEGGNTSWIRAVVDQWGSFDDTPNRAGDDRHDDYVDAGSGLLQMLRKQHNAVIELQKMYLEKIRQERVSAGGIILPPGIFDASGVEPDQEKTLLAGVGAGVRSRRRQLRGHGL